MFGSHEERKHSPAPYLQEVSSEIPREGLCNPHVPGDPDTLSPARYEEIALLSPSITVSGGVQHAVSRWTGHRL